VSAIVGDGVQFVEFIFTQAFGAQTTDAKTEACDDQNDESGEYEGAAAGQDTTAGKEVRSQSGSDDSFSSCGQIRFPQMIVKMGQGNERAV
jgi:hypothetical protein